jgi:predicted O-methyltransferase YrrM
MLKRVLIGVVAAGVLAGTFQLVAQDRPPRRGRPRMGQRTPPVENPPLAKDAAEKKALEVLDWLYKNQRRGMMNVPPDDGRFLRILTEAANAKHVVEIGTSNGYSGIWICLALRTTGGKLTTHEIDAGRAKLARENFKKAGVADIVTLVEGDAHKEVLKIEEPIDVLFLDADKGGYGDYFKKLLPKVRPGGLILAHNAVSQARSMQDYLKAITTSGELETIFNYTSGTGMAVTLKKRPTKAAK